MKSRRRVLIRFAWIFAVGVAFLAIYLQVGLLPGKALREQALVRIHEATGLRVEFTRLVFMPGTGLSFDDFRIAGAEGPSLFSAKYLHVDIKLLPFLFEKKIVIRNLVLESPVFEWSSAAAAPLPAPVKTQISGQIAVPVAPVGHTITLAALKAEGADALLPENVYLEQIEIRKGIARFYRQDGALNEIVEIAALKMAYRKPPIVDFTGEVLLGSPVYASLRIKGGWDLEQARYEFFLQFKSDRVPAWLDGYQKKHILILREGKIDLAAKLESITDMRASFHAKARLAGAHFQAAHASIRGQTAFDAKGIFDFDRQTFERYRGTLFLESTNLENLSAQFPKIEGVHGRIGFEPNLVTIESLRGTWQKLAFEAKGTIKSFKDLLLNGEIRSRLDIQDALALIPAEQKKLLAGFRLGGTCDALTTLKGSLKKGATVVREHRLVIDDGFLENPERKLKLDDLAAELVMDDKGLKIRNTRFRSGKTAYQLEASIPKKPASRGSLALSTAQWRLKADYDVQGENLSVRSGQADGFGASLGFSGRVLNIHNPSLNLKGSARVDMNKIQTLLPALRDAKLDGFLTGPFALSGPWNKPLKWDLRFDARAERLSVKEWYKVSKVEMQLLAQHGVIRVPHIHAKPYGGSVTASGSVDLNRAPHTFDIRVSGADLQLAQVARDLIPPRQDLEGSLVFQLEMRGPLSDQSAWTGSGSAGITHGNFGRTNRFKDMGKLPFVRVEGMDDVTFHQMRATYDVRDRKIWTDDLALYGDNVNLFLNGAIGFDAKLELAMRIRYSEGILEGAFDAGGIVPLVLSEANNMISDYRVKGSLDTPIFEKSFLPVNPVGSVTKKVNTLAKAITA